MICRELVEMIADALEGAASAESRRRFEAHLGGCRRCRQYLRSYANALELLRRAFDEDNAPASDPIPEELVEAILRSMRGPRPHPAAPPSRCPGVAHRVADGKTDPESGVS